MANHWWHLGLLTIVVMLVCACSGPNPLEIRRDFKAKNPSAEIIDMGPGEGDGDHVYIHIRFMLPTKAHPCEVVWGYRSGPGLSQVPWKRFSESAHGKAGTMCEGCRSEPCH